MRSDEEQMRGYFISQEFFEKSIDYDFGGVLWALPQLQILCWKG